MTKENFPYIALVLGVMLMLVVSVGEQTNETNTTRLPLLTLLIVSEFAFFLTAIGAYISIKQILSVGFNWKVFVVAGLCVLSAITFLVKGISLWPL